VTRLVHFHPHRRRSQAFSNFLLMMAFTGWQISW